MTRYVVVTGTDTDVGKTIATAALAVHLGGSPLVVKPTQTGVNDHEPGDCAVVHALSGVDVREGVRLREPLAPDLAAREEGAALPSVAEQAAWVRDLASDRELVVVEGAGGVLVHLDASRGTIVDLAAALRHPEDQVDVVVVTRAGLGTLNHSELTVRALRAVGIEPLGLVIGSWPREPDLATRLNRSELPSVCDVPLLGVLPAGAGHLSPADFGSAASGWFSAQV